MTAMKGSSTAKATDESGGESALEAVKGAVQEAAAGASKLASQGRDTAQEWAGAVADAAGHAKDSAQQWAGAAADAVDQAKGKAAELAATAADRVEDFGQDVTRLIRRYPLQAVLLGVGVGFLLARVTRHS